MEEGGGGRGISADISRPHDFSGSADDIRAWQAGSVVFYFLPFPEPFENIIDGCARQKAWLEN